MCVKISSAWIVCLAAFFVQFCNNSPSKTFGIILNSIATEYEVDYASATFICSLFGLSNALGGMVCSGVLDIVGCRIICAVGGVLAAAGFALTAYVRNINILYITFCVAGGIGISIMTLASMVQGAKYFDKRRSLVSAIIYSGSGAAGVIWPPIVNYLLVNFGLKKVMYLYASACIVCAYLAFFLKPPCEDRSSEEEGRYILLEKDDFPVSGKSSFIDISMTETNNINSLQKPNQTNGPKEQDEENHEQITAAKKIISTLL